MKEIKLTIDGKEVQLTNEQLKMLGVEPEKMRKNPFDRANPAADDKYYYIRVSGDVADYRDVNDNADRLLYEASNYFNDKSFAEQVALHQLLYRKLLKFAYDNNCEDEEWNGMNDHWLIVYFPLNDDFVIANVQCVKEHTVYFSTEEGASRAINEVIRPFMKEHPDFVW